MSRATEAFAALQQKMTETDPACQEDPRFIADDEPADDLAPICNRCPLLDLCTVYANIERPKGGIWAGRRYSQYKTGGAA